MANFAQTPSGELRHRVKLLQQQDGAPNELNETTPTTVVVRTVWAKVTPISAMERMDNARITMDVTHEVRMRYVPYVDSTYTLDLNGRLLDIIDVRDIEEQHIELIFTCHEQRGSKRVN